jgi:hypothetical protein
MPQGCWATRNDESEEKEMKKKWFSLILFAASLLVLAPTLRAQAVYTATRSTRIQAGVGVEYLQPDYTDKNVIGASVWGDFDFKKYLGLEASIHIGAINTPDDFSETSYMVGPRLLYRKRNLTGYGKLLAGRATLTNDRNSQSAGYNAYAFGGGIEYRALRKLNIRVVDLEIQKWPNFEPNTLSPLVITIGASYIIR